MLKQIDHVNIVVHDIEAMVGFYTDVLGMEVTKRATIRGEWIGQTVGLDDVEADVVYLDLPHGPRIELIQYLKPQAQRPPGLDMANTPGLRHMAFRVEHILEAVETLKQKGVHPLSPIQQVPDSQVTYAGGVRKRLVYFRDPEGNILELCEYA